MGARNESFKVEKTGENYLITQTTTEEVNEAELLNYYTGLSESEEKAKESISQIPEQVKKRTAEFEGQLKLLTPRRIAFEEFAKPLKEKKDAEDEKKRREEIEKQKKEIEAQGGMNAAK